MSSTKNNNQITYAFVDSQNLNLGIRSQRWKLDYKKFRLYLKNKYNVSKAFMFIGMVEDNQSLYTQLQEAGFILIFKPTIQYFENGKKTVKGNVDAELVLHAAAIQYSNYDKAIIVSGDGDFGCLIEFLEMKSKLLYVLTPNRHYSSLLRRFDKCIKRIDNARSSIEYKPIKKTRTSGRCETLGIPGHGDTINIAKTNKKVNKKYNNKFKKK